MCVVDEAVADRVGDGFVADDGLIIRDRADAASRRPGGVAIALLLPLGSWLSRIATLATGSCARVAPVANPLK